MNYLEIIVLVIIFYLTVVNNFIIKPLFFIVLLQNILYRFFNILYRLLILLKFYGISANCLVVRIKTNIKLQ